jgi:hypothetical protein
MSTATTEISESTASVVKVYAEVSGGDDEILTVCAELGEHAPWVKVTTVGHVCGTGTLRLPSIAATRALIAALENVCDRAESGPALSMLMARR